MGPHGWIVTLVLLCFTVGSILLMFWMLLCAVLYAQPTAANFAGGGASGWVAASWTLKKKKPSRHIPPAREEFCSLRWTRIDLLDLLDRRCLSRETVSIEQEHERAVNIDACVDVA